MKKITFTISLSKGTDTQWIEGTFESVNYDAVNNKLRLERTPGTDKHYSHNFIDYNVSCTPYVYTIYDVISVVIESL